MKKFIAVLVIAGFISSCNNAAETPATPNADSLKAADSAAAAATPAVDTTKVAADTTKVADSTAKMSADTSKKK